MGQLTFYSGGIAPQETWEGKSLKIGLAKKGWLPDDEAFNLWFEGHCTSFSTGGGTRESESVSMMGGYNKQFQKPQEDFEITLDLLPTDTTFDELLLGDEGFYADLFDSHDDNTALQVDWTEAGDGANPTLDTTNFRSGKQGMKLTWTHSGGTSTWVLDLSTHLGAVQDTSGFTGSSGANATRGRAEMVVYIGDATDLANLTTISLRIGSTSGNYSQYNYTVSGKLRVGWNKVVYDMTTADASVGTTAWTSLDYCAILLTHSGSSSTGVTIDRIRFYDPTVTSDQIPSYWRLTLLYETSSTATVGEKLRAEVRDCQVTGWEPSSDADGHRVATITLRAPPLDESGNANYKIEHTPDASEAALTTPSSY